jgi:hypothetical protein
MKKTFVSIMGVLAFVIVVGTTVPHAAHAAINVFQNCSSNADTAVCKATGDKLFGPTSIWTNILNTLIYATGSISVLMVVIGGLRYTISNGDQGGLTSAKNTILYAVVGLVLSLMGYAIVNFVLSRI